MLEKLLCGLRASSGRDAGASWRESGGLGGANPQQSRLVRWQKNPGKLRCLIVLAVLLFVIFAENMHIETYVSVLKFNNNNKKA